MEITQQLGIDIRKRPEFLAGFRQLHAKPTTSVVELLRWLEERYGEEAIIDRALVFETTVFGYAEFWGVCLEEALSKGIGSVMVKFGLTEEEFNELADQWEREHA